MVLALVVLACVGGGKPPEVAGGAEATIPEVGIPATSAPPAAAATAAAATAGRYEGKACGSRAYVRLLELRGDGTYELEDRISPCPPGVACMWSGIVTFAGTWTEGAQGVALTEAKGPEGPGAQPRAAAYTRDAGGLVDDAGCAFSRVVGP